MEKYNGMGATGRMLRSQRRVAAALLRFLAEIPDLSAWWTPAQRRQAERLQRAVFDGLTTRDVIRSATLRLDFTDCPGPPGLS